MARFSARRAGLVAARSVRRAARARFDERTAGIRRARFEGEAPRLRALATSSSLARADACSAGGKRRG